MNLFKRLKNSIFRIIANHCIIPSIRKYLWRKSGIILGKKTFINMNLTIIDNNIGGMVKIGDRVSIAPNVTIINKSSPNDSILASKFSKTGDVVIEDDCWIGAGVVILPGVKISKKSIVLSNSVVTKSISKGTINGGVPSKLIKGIDNE